MMKRIVAVVVVCLLAFPALDATAAKKKKKTKPYKSEQVTLGIPHPLAYSATGSVNSVTAKEFENRCASPATNGVDAHIFEVPKDYQSTVAIIDAVAAPLTPVPYDIDLYFYDADCTHTIAANSAGADESGLMPKGTAWIMLHTYTGEPNLRAHIELKPSR